MIVFLAIIQFVVISYVCYFEFKKKSPAVFLWATLLIMFGIMHLLSAFLGSFKFDDQTINESSLFVIVFSLLYLLTRICIGKKNENIQDIIVENTTENNRYVKSMVLIFILLIVVNIFLLVKTAGGISNTSWETMRNMIKESSYSWFSQLFLYIFFASASSGMLCFKIGKKKWGVIIILMVIVETLISRNRIELLPAIIILLIMYIFKIKKINLKHIVIIAVLSLFVVYFVYGIRAYRLQGSMKNFFADFSLSNFNQQIKDAIETDDGELGLRNNFYYFIKQNNQFKDFGKLNTYIRVLMVLVPTKLSFGLKPEDFALSMGKAILPSVVGFSTHPTLFGDCYANAGFFGFFLGIFWALYVSVFDRFINKRKKVVKISLTVLITISYVIIGRGSIYNGVAIWIFGAIVILFINMFSKIKIRKNIKTASNT